MSKAVILYCVAALQLILGLYILIDAFPSFQTGVISPVSYFGRGIGPLILAAAFIHFARMARGSEGANNA